MAAPVAEGWSWFLTLAAGISLLKGLLINTYHSTDFEVHRNWLAITHSLPLSLWYYEDTSEWTLDYPPLFAWFEFGLSHIAKFFDKEMLVVQNLNYASSATIIFQRLSVIFTDIVFIYAVKEWCQCVRGIKGPRDLWLKPGFVLAVLLLWNFGLIVVDRIRTINHDQLTTIHLLTYLKKCSEHTVIQFFCVQILRMKRIFNRKYIFLYIAYFLFIDGSVKWRSLSFARLAVLGTIVCSVFALSFGHFLKKGQLPQVLSRLFPFKRGLCHAYWAPNFWALYNVLDKTLSVLGTALFHLTALLQKDTVCIVCTVKGWFNVLFCFFRIMYIEISFSAFQLRSCFAELPIKILLMLMFTLYSLTSLKVLFRREGCLLNSIEAAYLAGLVPLEIFCELVYPMTVWKQSLPFIPLLLTSVYCALGVTYSFIRLYISLLTRPEMDKSKHQ
uniref:Alpha-1,3-glucosyltransferase n=1 Tax=Lepisosteus oculatus TaxID=7918 RepID=W5MFN4_LEPOC